jgi:hypothetical protein
MRNKPLIYFLSVLAFIALLVVGYFLYLVLTNSKTEPAEEDKQEETVDNETEEEPEDTEEEQQEETNLPEGWIEQESSGYGYKIGVPENWYYRFFSSTKMIGIDPDPIPEASEYAGVITFAADDRTFEQMLSQTKDYLEDEEETSITVNEVEWTQVEGKISMDDFFNPGEAILYAMTQKDGTAYRLTLLAPENEEYRAIYLQLLETITLE